MSRSCLLKNVTSADRANSADQRSNISDVGAHGPYFVLKFYPGLRARVQRNCHRHRTSAETLRGKGRAGARTAMAASSPATQTHTRAEAAPRSGAAWRLAKRVQVNCGQIAQYEYYVAEAMLSCRCALLHRFRSEQLHTPMNGRARFASGGVGLNVDLARKPQLRPHVQTTSAERSLFAKIANGASEVQQRADTRVLHH
eukprot:6192617-Pleurochrysis_carterae.AAC.2